MFHRLSRLGAGAVLTVSVATAAGAQSPALSSAAQAFLPPQAPLSVPAVTPTAPDSGATTSAGPTLAGTSAALQARSAAPVVNADSVDAQLAYQARSGLRQSQVLMILGGAAFLAGAIIGDDAGTIIMVGGAAVGLYGLYQFLQ